MPKPHYFAYLIRLWPSQEAGETVWRVLLEDVNTHQQLGFARLEELIQYLQQRTREEPKPGGRSLPEDNQFTPSRSGYRY